MIESPDAGALYTQDERAGTGVFDAFIDSLEEVWIVGGDNDGNYKRAEGIENDQTIDESFGCFLDISSGRLSLASSNGD